MPLTDSRIKIQPALGLGDEEGPVSPVGTKPGRPVLVSEYRFAGKEKLLALGIIQNVPQAGP